jgi:hypothetical protein
MMDKERLIDDYISINTSRRLSTGKNSGEKPFIVHEACQSIIFSVAILKIVSIRGRDRTFMDEIEHSWTR